MLFVALAEKLSVSKTQITDIVANRDALYKTWARNGGEKRKFSRGNEMLNWFSNLREKNLPV